MNEQIKAGANIMAGDGGYSLGTREKYEEFVKARKQSTNEARIKQYADQAHQYAMDVIQEGEDFGDIMHAKFAELILNECIDIANNTRYDGKVVANRIKFVFGLE